MELPEPIPDPAALARLARSRGLTLGGLEALLRLEVYVTTQMKLAAWPWYPEEDGEEEAAGLARELGVEMPPYRLDEPFESSFYIGRSGHRGLDLLAGSEDVWLTTLPEPSQEEFLEVVNEGGFRAPHPARQWWERVRELAQRYEYYPEEERAALRQQMYEAAKNCLDAEQEREEVGGPSSEETRLESAGPGNIEPPPAEGLSATSEHVYIALDGRIWEVSASGVVTRSAPASGQLLFCDGRTALFEHYALGLVDLDAGIWREGSVESTGGKAARILGMLDSPWISAHNGVISGCGRYLWDPESWVVTRLADAIVVGEEQYDFVSEAPEVFEVVECPLSDDAVEAVIEGVRFTLRRKPSRVRGASAYAFALYGGTFRFCARGILYEGYEPVARLGMQAVHAAFTPSGDALWVLGPEHLVKVEWSDAPRFVAAYRLDSLLEGDGRDG